MQAGASKEDAFVVVLGVAQDGGVPQAGCWRPCCARALADARWRRKPACIGIVRGDDAWMIDATPEFG